MTLVQFLAAGLAILFIVKTVSDFKDKKISGKGFVLWILVWIAIAVIAFLPQITEPLRKVLGIGRGIDVAVYFSIVFIFYILFEIIKKITKTEREIAEIVREIALKDFNPKNE